MEVSNESIEVGVDFANRAQIGAGVDEIDESVLREILGFLLIVIGQLLRPASTCSYRDRKRSSCRSSSECSRRISLSISPTLIWLREKAKSHRATSTFFVSISRQRQCLDFRDVALGRFLPSASRLASPALFSPIPPCTSKSPRVPTSHRALTLYAYDCQTRIRSAATAPTRAEARNLKFAKRTQGRTTN
jgi:hypothetical protein